MSIFLLVRAVSDRFIDGARDDDDLMFALLDRGLPAPEWHVNAVRDAERRKEKMAGAQLTFARDAGELHDLGGAWDGLQRTMDKLGAPNVFVMGMQLGDEESGTRVLTSDEANEVLAAIENVARGAVEQAVREVLNAKPRVEERRNPFTGQMVTVRERAVYGLDRASEDEAVAWLSDSFERLRDILRDARSRGFGIALQIVL